MCTSKSAEMGAKSLILIKWKRGTNIRVIRKSIAKSRACIKDMIKLLNLTPERGRDLKLQLF